MGGPCAVRVASLFLLAACWLQAARTDAQSVHDGGVWLSLNTQGDFDPLLPSQSKLRWWFDGHLRYLEDAGGYNQSIARPALGYAITPNATLWLGYAWINESPVSGQPSFNENRIWEQLTWAHRFRNSTISTRTRLEQRFVETGGDTGSRFRHLGKIDRPFRCESRLSLVAWDEAFFDLNSTDWGQQASFSQNRAFVGLGWQFRGNGKPKIEFGYLNQFLRRRSADDGFNHIASLNWFWTF